MCKHIYTVITHLENLDIHSIMRTPFRTITAIMLACAFIMPLAACDSSILPSMSGDEHQDGATLKFDPSNRYRDQTAPEKSNDDNNKNTVQTTGTDKRDINTIVEEVIEGKYANGEERKIKLGDRYDEVQKLVNQKCLVEKDPRCVSR